MTETDRQEGFSIRHAHLADIPALLDLERQSPTAGHWTESQYQNALQGGHRLVLVTEGAQNACVSAFLVASQVSTEWELENIVVAAGQRRHGLASKLLASLLTSARDMKSESIFLEVRESNLGARALYERTGFHQTGRRQGYYTSPMEDAILYRLSLKFAPKIS
jgi:ribosomal-protein-alanine acetyltransferase